MSREKLPNRRECRTSTIVWRNPAGGGEHSIHVSVGLHPGGRGLEMFASISKNGTLLRTMLEQGAVLASHLAQRGMDFAEMVYHRGGHDYCPATPLEAALIEAAELSKNYRGLPE